MEDALRVAGDSPARPARRVLILVLMEDALRVERTMSEYDSEDES